MLYSPVVDHETEQELIFALARRDGTAKEIARHFNMSKAELLAFVDENRDALELARERVEMAAEIAAEAAAERRKVDAALSGLEGAEDDLDPNQLDELWITKKYERLKRYQLIVDRLYKLAANGSGLTDATVLRELRSFMRYAAEELGQLLHRGSGEAGDSSLTYNLVGVDPDTLR